MVLSQKTANMKGVVSCN